MLRHSQHASHPPHPRHEPLSAAPRPHSPQTALLPSDTAPRQASNAVPYLPKESAQNTRSDQHSLVELVQPSALNWAKQPDVDLLYATVPDSPSPQDAAATAASHS